MSSIATIDRNTTRAALNAHLNITPERAVIIEYPLGRGYFGAIQDEMAGIYGEEAVSVFRPEFMDAAVEHSLGNFNQSKAILVSLIGQTLTSDQVVALINVGLPLVVAKPNTFELPHSVSNRFVFLCSSK